MKEIHFYLGNFSHLDHIFYTYDSTEEAIKQGRNIAIPTTGLSEYVVRLATPAKKNGYQVKLVHINVDKETAIQRVMDRYQREGRFIDPYFVATRAPYMESELVNFENPELVDEVEILEF